MAIQQILKITPLKEIIFAISFKESIENATLAKFIELPEIKDAFPIINKGFHAHVHAPENQKPITNVSEDGFILKNNNPESNSNLISVKRGSISFHKINGYDKFENLLSEFRIFWDLLEKCAGPLRVNGLTVRYLNFITVLQNEKIEDLINIYTVHPFESKSVNSFSQHKFQSDINPNISITVVSAKGKNNQQEGQQEGIILDIILNKVLNNEVFNFDTFNEMQKIKNDIFFSSISEETIKKYI